ncbi:kinesin-like protein KIFC1 isoform X1 [Gopherus flavomarginatus]|uniref:kinesin-like protein KIFC1 isoform X1 n=1 Tax=Gopherus flavomarginatus TaxID=286002 RepID=UPI0021CBA4FB|nr:kinesin-like protein KIFC1 isoform X1 [Gopherus flavomarginatus]
MEQKGNADGWQVPLVGKAFSQLPVPGLRAKRGPSDENQPPAEQKRARRLPVPTRRVAASIATSCSKASAAAVVPRTQRAGRRTSLRPELTIPAASVADVVRRPVPMAAAPKMAAPALAVGNDGKKRAAWDLKGQLSDMRTKVSSYKDKVQRLDGENQQLKRQLQEQVVQNRELSSQVSILSSALHTCQEQAQQRLHEVMELSDLKQQLEEQVTSYSKTIGQLEGTKRDLSSLLETREVKLKLAEEGLAQRECENKELRGQVAAQLQVMTQQEERLHHLEMERRRLHNLVQELKGNIRVFCRVRPLLAWEKERQKGLEHLHFPLQDNKALVLSKVEESHVGRDRKGDVKYDFSFDRVFSPACSQEEVFEEIALLVQSALDGYHVCIFAYGQTGSGKTYTMEGPDDMSPETMGMIPRAVRQVFQGARELEPKGWQYHFTANFLEIYNESLRDLLVGRPERGAELEIKRVSQSSEELHVPNLRYVPVDSEDEVLKLLQTAKANRSVAKTALNDRSSRSHSLFQLRIEGWNRSRDLHSVSVLSLVDLAGSERLDKSFSKGERLRETQAINTSLSTLGLVIMALSNKEPHIPYRNSKLTYLLQNSLGGNSKMLMFVNISPLEDNLSESLNSLRFASKVNECVIGTAQANRK